jgi:glycosyltransferase involved in cell wall biosynthesis
MMRLLQLIRSRRLAGSEQLMLTLSLELMRQGHEVDVAVRRGGELAAHYREAGLNVLDIDLDTLFCANRLARHVHENCVDVVHGHLTAGVRLAVTLARRTGVACVGHAHVLRNAKAYRDVASLGALIAVSRDTARAYAGMGIAPEKIEVIHNATRIRADVEDGLTNITARRRFAEALGLPDEVRFISCLGRISPGKGQDVLIEAMADVVAAQPRAHLLIAGGQARKGEYARSLDDLPARLGIGGHVHRLGFRSDTAAVLLAADVHAVPSREEPFGLVVIEGLMMGRPVVASRVGGIPEILCSADHGLLVEPENPTALAGAILALLEDDALARRVAESGQRHAMEEFAPEVMTRRITEVYQRLLSRH